MHYFTILHQIIVIIENYFDDEFICLYCMHATVFSYEWSGCSIKLYFASAHCRKPASEAHEDEGPFLPRPSGGPAPSYYRYGAPAEYGRPGPVPDDYMPWDDLRVYYSKF